MSKKNDLFAACRALKAQRDKVQMNKLNHRGVTNSRQLHIIY